MSSSVPFMDLGRVHATLAAGLRDAFDRVLANSAFILGEEVERFEEEFARFCGSGHCVGVGSGTAAITIMLQAAGIGRGDQVIVPAHTFLATALAVLHAGAEPVCVDVESSTGLIDPAAAADALGPRTAAILPVHLYGQACAMDELRALATRHALALFEDAAQAQGATYNGKRAGGLGDAGAFSFYPSKNLGALGDAGAICTGDSELAARARRLRDLGRSNDASHLLPGYNERLDGMQAAFLRVKLAHVEGWNRERRALAAGYRERLGAIEQLEEKPESPCIYHLFPIKTRERDAVAKSLGEFGISTGIHYPLALPDQPALRAVRSSDAPNARDWAARELSVPLFPGMTERELDAVAWGLESVIRTGDRLGSGGRAQPDLQ
ncbi:MAG TPA: DegT/DnrJ/EryC1/StrS family aminotransferase [Solirubrobacteraceae bacterium]